MADRNVTLDIVGRDKTGPAVRSAARNFENLKRKADGSIASIGDGAESSLPKKFAKLATKIATPLTLAIGAISPGIAAAITSGFALGAGGGLLGLAALFLNGSKKLGIEGNAKFKEAAAKVGKTITATMTKAAEPLVRPFLDALGKIHRLVEELAPEFNYMFRMLKPVVPLMTTAFGGLVREVVLALKDSMPGINAAFRGLAAAMPTVGKWIGEFIRTLLKNPGVIENVTKTLTLLTAGPLKLLGPMLQGLTVIFGAQANLWRLLGIAGEKLWPKLVKWFKNFNGAAGPLKEAWDTLWTHIKKVWDKLKEFAAAKTDKEIIQKFKELVVEINSAWEPLKEFLRRTWEAAWTAIKKIWNEKVVPWWNDTAKPWLKKAFSAAMDEAIDMMKGKAKAELAKLPGVIISALASLPGKITAALVGKMAGAGASIGRAFVNGMISAINGGKGRVVGVGSAVASAGAAAAKAAAGSFSGSGSWAPALTAAQFAGGASFAAAGGTSRTGGPVAVNQTLNVSLDGAPFWSYTAQAISESEKRQSFRSKVGRR